MKKFFFLAVMLLMILSACQKEEISPATQYENVVVAENAFSDDNTVITSEHTDEEISDSIILKSTGIIQYQVSPKFGKPNNTYYYFRVYSVSSLAISVKLYNRATGAITYLPMTRSGNNWVLSTRISANGWYAYRYVYTLTKNPVNSSTPSYELCNTRNTFNHSGISSISWPFGADGSNWGNRTVYVNGSSQTWRGGQEGGSGYGWNQGTHTGTAERYSDDWNRGTGSQDLGAIIRSPLDGYIETIGTYHVSGYGNSRFVSIIQQGADGRLYLFYVSHLHTTASGLYSGKYVRAGIDQIGTLGMSGASSPHAHTNMRVNGASVRFYFNAQ